jgi:pseudouridine kinase
VHHVVVIGGANIDVKAKSHDELLLATSNIGKITFAVGGVGRNIAANLSRLGTACKLISIVGHDAHGDRVIEQTRAAGVDTSLMMRGEGVTGCYAAILNASGEMVVALSDMDMLEQLTWPQLEKHRDTLAASRFIVADCNLPVATLEKLVQDYGGKLIVEPVSLQKSSRLLTALAKGKVYMATPNRDQLHAMAELKETHAAAKRLNDMGIEHLVVLAGRDGALILDNAGYRQIQTTQLAEITDVTGAGDAAVAGLVNGLMNGQSLDDAVMGGQRAAARVIASSESSLV